MLIFWRTAFVGVHTGIDSGYSPTAADFCMPGPLFARAVHISQAKIGTGSPLFTPDQLSRDSTPGGTRSPVIWYPGYHITGGTKSP